tara:strand:+ start:29 stop:1522 length:1494 start_codon:yes stop_codon:yes gene_type:complete
MRAAAHALGYLRALHSAGLLARVRYVCSNSGGSWVATPALYQTQVSASTFFGPERAPAELELARCREDARQDGGAAKVLADANFLRQFFLETAKDALAMDFLRGKDRVKIRAWSDAVGDCFLAAHGLGDHGAAFAVRGEPAARARRETGAELCYEWPGSLGDTAPFPVAVGAVQPKGDPLHSHPLEFTPMYCGVPTPLDLGEGRSLGGNLVEPFGLNAAAPGAASLVGGEQGAPLEVTLQAKWTVPLTQAVGISSAYVAQTQVDSAREGLWEAAGCDELHLWSGTDPTYGQETPVGDGGGCDNLAVYAALRRGVRKLLIFYNFYRDPATFKSAEEFAASYYDISGLFGACPETPAYFPGSVEEFNRHQHTFETAEFLGLFEELKQLSEKKEPVLARRTLRVLPCPDMGVRGGFEADVLFLGACCAAGWHDELPFETRAHILEKINAPLQEEGEGHALPFIPTNQLDYDPETVSLVSHLAAWTVKRNRDAIKSVLEDA